MLLNAYHVSLANKGFRVWVKVSDPLSLKLSLKCDVQIRPLARLM